MTLKTSDRLGGKISKPNVTPEIAFFSLYIRLIIGIFQSVFFNIQKRWSLSCFANLWPAYCITDTMHCHTTPLCPPEYHRGQWFGWPWEESLKRLLFPWLQHLTGDGILYITPKAFGSSCSQSETWSLASSFVLPLTPKLLVLAACWGNFLHYLH